MNMLNLSSNFLSEAKDLNELTLIENKSKIYIIHILLIEIFNKESKEIINPNNKTILIFFKMIIESK
jgi:hypothetical protein